MGTVADAALQAGGDVIGVIPRHVEDRELAHHGLTDLYVVESMHARKALMAELSDAFVALPVEPARLTRSRNSGLGRS